MKSLPMLRASLALRQVRARLSKLRRTPEPQLDLTAARAKLHEELARVTATTAWQAGRELESIVDNSVADWLAKVEVHHRSLTTELELLATRVTEVRELYQVHHEDQTKVLNDLEGAVSHALERVSDPDSPFFQPDPHRHGGGDR
ncbi:hypothetical protein ACQPW3_03475 [Actinosynnema sp. CA-248983]